MASGAITACGAASATPATRFGHALDRRHEPDQRAAPIEHRSAAAARLHCGDDGGPRLAAGERSRARGEARSGETEHDDIRPRRAEARRFALGAEIAGDHRQICRRVGPLDPYRLAVDRRVRAVVRLERRQRPAGRDDERRRRRRGIGRGRSRAGSGRDGGAVAALSAGVVASCGNGSKELATAIATRSS